jgi:hypothetical protein
VVFDDPNCLTFVERVERGEERWHAIGVIGGRNITARRADAQKGSFMPEFSDAQHEDILALTNQLDEDIDYSDIPPIREIPEGAVRGRFYRGNAIYLNDDLHAYFSTVAMRRGVSLNELVNNVLTREIALVEELK